MQFRIVSLLALATLSLSSGGILTAQAKTSYHRTKTTTIKTKPFYSVSNHGATYRANGSLTNFKFKKNHALKNYRDSTWVATSKTYIKMHGKNRLYYYVHNSDRKTQGWVWHGYLKPGKHNQMRRQDTKATGQYMMVKPGKLYQFGSVYGSKGFDPFNVRFKNGIKLSDQVTYKRTQTWTIFKHGKKSTYYYVTTSDKQIKGWVWHGFLKPGKAEMTSDKPTENAKPGNTVTNSNNMNSKPTVNPIPAPTNPAQKPELGINDWLNDDGKRERVVANYFDVMKHFQKGGSYQGNISIEEVKGTYDNKKVQRHVYDNIANELVKTDPYQRYYQQYSMVNGKKVLVKIQNPILLNGDAIYYDNFFVSVNEPLKQKKYETEYSSDYVTESPVWYQYNTQSGNFTLWRFNLNKQQWDKISSNVEWMINY